jgi:hypothetical protein
VSRRKIGNFLPPAVGVALAAGSAVVAAAWLLGRADLAWALAGWGSAAAIGVAGGAWMAARQGLPGGGFVVALLAGMLARLLAVGAGAALAASVGGGALWAFVGGFFAGFVPLAVWEALYFYRASGIRVTG